jgi:hypothetical protein
MTQVMTQNFRIRGPARVPGTSPLGGLGWPLTEGPSGKAHCSKSPDLMNFCGKAIQQAVGSEEEVDTLDR